MGNLKLSPEHIELLNGLSPHLGKKGQASADKILGLLKLFAGQPAQGGMDSVLKLMSAAGAKSNDDVLQIVGNLFKNLNIRSLSGNSSTSGSSLLIFLALILLLQDFK